MSRTRLAKILVLGVVLVCGVAAYAYYRSGVPEYRPPALPADARALELNVLGRGPLRVATANPRYFADGSGRIVLLVAGSCGSNLQDNGPGELPAPFDYDRYLDFLAAHHVNFFRLWAWEQARWAPWTTSDDYYFFPGPVYRRTGPGVALDGRPKFDLRQLYPAYFERLRARVQQAGERGIYVSIMLFNGWAIDNAHSSLRRGNAWHGHPFNRQNNINGVDGDPNGNDGGEETHQLLVPAVTAYQEEYVRRVIDSVNDLDNVLFEISNESYANSKQWQYHMIDFVHAYEAGKPQRHPVGMSQYQWPGSNAELFASPARVDRAVAGAARLCVSRRSAGDGWPQGRDRRHRSPVGHRRRSQLGLARVPARRSAQLHGRLRRRLGRLRRARAVRRAYGLAAGHRQGPAAQAGAAGGLATGCRAVGEPAT